MKSQTDLDEMPSVKYGRSEYRELLPPCLLQHEPVVEDDASDSKEEEDEDPVETQSSARLPLTAISDHQTDVETAAPIALPMPFDPVVEHAYCVLQ